MKATIRKLEHEIFRLTIENNSLKNLVRSMPETRETHEARKLVGVRRFEDRIESENDVEPSKDPLYLTNAPKVDQSNGSRLRAYESKRNQVAAGFTNVFPIEVD